MPNTARVAGIIPARLESSRLRRKLLQKINGKPLIYYTYTQARSARCLGRLMVACDHEALAQAVRSFGGEAVLTRLDHASGTSRVAEAAADLSADIIINIQGDEPLIHPDTIDTVGETLLKAGPSISMATASMRCCDRQSYLNPSVVKVVTAQDGTALYFSRSPLPHHRDSPSSSCFDKHVGIYAYRYNFLQRFSELPPCPLAEQEKLEQLIPLAAGVKIAVAETAHDSIGIDTPADLEQVRQIIEPASQPL